MVRNVMLNLSFLMMKIKKVMTYKNLKRKTKVGFIEIFSQEIYFLKVPIRFFWEAIAYKKYHFENYARMNSFLNLFL